MHRNMGVILVTLLLLGLTAAGICARPQDPPTPRFFHSGDGQIRLVSEKNGERFAGRYRLNRGTYDEAALASTSRVFGAPFQSIDRMALSLRLIEFLDFLEDRLGKGALITITSGYRHPRYNTRLRKQGALAAKASLHQYGMAADLKMAGVASKRIWEYIKAGGFGGTGFYHGETVHVDVGPARFWDENSSGVGTGISDDNKLIGLVTEFDVYRPDEVIVLRFIRMTVFPIGVDPVFELLPSKTQDNAATPVRFRPAFNVPAEGSCPRFADIEQMAFIRWRIPAQLPPGRYTIQARFCENPWDVMPAEITTPEFEVLE